MKTEFKNIYIDSNLKEIIVETMYSLLTHIETIRSDEQIDLTHQKNLVGYEFLNDFISQILEAIKTDDGVKRVLLILAENYAGQRAEEYLNKRHTHVHECGFSTEIH